MHNSQLNNKLIYFVSHTVMKLDVSEIKKNTILEIDGQLYKVLDFAFMQMQQRQGSYTFKLKNLVTGSVQNTTYKSGSVIEK
jgi:translation elongation factor P/translation initiation factor 5A